MGDLRIARFIGPYQAQAGAAYQWSLPVEKKKKNEREKDGPLADSGPTGQPYAPTWGRIRSGRFLNSFHYQCFSNGALLASHRQAMPALIRAVGGIAPSGLRPIFLETRK